MANKNVFNIGIGTEVDTSGLEKGLSEVEKEVIKSAAEQLKVIENAADEQIRVIQQAEAEKIAEVKKSTEEQIAIVKANTGLDKAAMQEQIDAIRERENEKIKLIKSGSKLEEQVIRDREKNLVKQVQDSTKKQLQALKDFSKKGVQALKDFAKSAGKELLGLDQLLGAVAGGPAAWGKLAVDAGKKVVAALNEMAAMYREQEQAEVALQNAAKNNPYLNDRNVKQLISFGNEMQRITGIDSVIVDHSQARLATLGRNQQEIQNIIKTAADMSARGLMDFDSAVSELNRSLNGVVGRGLGLLAPELKNLTVEALASGEAIDIMAGKVSGAAAEAMKTGTGSVTAYNNAVANLKKALAQEWEASSRSAREWMTEILNKIVDATEKYKIFLELLKKEGELDPDDQIKALEIEIAKLQDTSFGLLKTFKELGGASGVWLKNMFLPTAIYNLVKFGGVIKETNKDHSDTIAKLQAQIEELKKIQGMTEKLANIQERLNVAREKAGKELKDEQAALQALADAGEAFAAGNKEAFDIAIKKAEELTKKVEGEVRIIEETARVREENYKALDKQLKKDILNARIKGDITKEEADRLNAIIDARKEGEALGELETSNLELQKQILDANVQAYTNLLTAAEAYLTEGEKSDIVDNLHEQWQAYEKLAQSEEERKKRLADMVKQQEKLQESLNKMLQAAQEEGQRQKQLADEKRHQDYLAKIKKESLLEVLGFSNKSAREAIEYQAQYERQKVEEARNKNRADALNSMNEQLANSRNIQNAAIEDARGNEEKITQIKQQGEAERAQISDQFRQTEQQLEQNAAAETLRINEEMNAEIERADRELLQKRLANVQSFLNASQSIANSISTIWHNSIDYELNEKLRANDKMEQSDEDRAKNEKKLMMEAAYERYKADMVAWAANVTLATAQAAMAVLNALATGGAAAIPLSIAAGVAGGLQVAAVISAQPKPPRFHEGGIVQGRAGQEVPALLMAGEPVLTQTQFSNTMEAISNLANMKSGSGAGTTLNLKIENNAGDVAQAKFDPDTMRVTIEKITQDAIASGRMNNAFAEREFNLSGTDFQ